MNKREIKFRVFGPDGMIYFDDLCHFCVFMTNARIEHRDGFYDVLQYTGLKDKKRTKKYPEGQEIYEGDIVKGAFRTSAGDTEVRGPIDFEEGCFGFTDFLGFEVYTLNRVREREVIGNVFENPELLDGAK